MGSARDPQDPHAGHRHVPKLILAGRLTGTVDGRPVVISADEAGVILDVSTLYSGWRLRKYGSAVLPVLKWLNTLHIPLVMRVAGAVSVPLLPKSGLLVRLFAPSIANG
jgi:hypothetical protein